MLLFNTYVCTDIYTDKSINIIHAYKYVTEINWGWPNTKEESDEVEEVDEVTVELTVSIPKHYIGFYNAVSKLGDMGSLEFIAAGGISGYINALSDEILKNGVSAIYPANPEILSREKLNKVMVSIRG